MRRRGGRRLSFYGIFIVGVLLNAACTTSPSAPSNGDNPIPVSGAPLVLRAGDVVSVEFLYHPELNMSQTVRPDGRISLRIVNEVSVAGLTPAEVRESLLESYRPTLIDPEITVVLKTEERFVSVGGEVNIPSGQFPIRVPLVSRLTPMEAIMQAGGFKNRSADLSTVLIIRRIGEKQYARTVDLSASLSNAECEPFFLEPDDIVFVPRTRIDRVDQWVDQYMNQLVPEWIRLNMGYSYARTETGDSRATVTVSPSGVSVSRSK